MLSRLSSIAVFALAALFAHSASYASTAPTSKTANKAVSKKKTTKKAAPIAEEAPNVADAVATDYECELGHKLTFYNRNAEDTAPALRWNNRLHKMTRIDTSTGAIRFENSNSGLVWIGLANKGMLLDSKKGQQLANECKNAEQKNAPPIEQAVVNG